MFKLEGERMEKELNPRSIANIDKQLQDLVSKFGLHLDEHNEMKYQRLRTETSPDKKTASI